MADISLINVRAFANYEPKNTSAEWKLLWSKHVQMATAVHCKTICLLLCRIWVFSIGQKTVTSTVIYADLIQMSISLWLYCWFICRQLITMIKRYSDYKFLKFLPKCRGNLIFVRDPVTVFWGSFKTFGRYRIAVCNNIMKVEETFGRYRIAVCNNIMKVEETFGRYRIAVCNNIMKVSQHLGGIE